MWKVIVGGLAALVVLVAVSLFGTYISYHNTGAQYETKLEATWQENKVVLNTYTTKVQEVAQVPAMHKKDLQEIVKQTFEGRYGKDGSKAVFQFITENNLNLDPQLYRQIQQVMESGRNDFQTSQKSLIDVKRSYETQLNMFWSGLWLKVAGYPKINLNKYKIVVLDDVNTKFESGKDSVIKLN